MASRKYVSERAVYKKISNLDTCGSKRNFVEEGVKIKEEPTDEGVLVEEEEDVPSLGPRRSARKPGGRAQVVLC
jgi:hypothetical protein